MTSSKTRLNICRAYLISPYHIPKIPQVHERTAKLEREIDVRRMAETKLAEQLKIRVEELTEREARLEAQAEDLVRLTDSLTSARDQLEKLNDQKDKFFSILAHDLKGPFNTLLGYSSLLSSGGKEMEKDKIERYGEALHQSAQQVFKLLENLLEWSLLQMGRMECDLRPVDINEVINTNMRLYAPLAEEKNITLTSHYDGQTVTQLNDNWDNPVMVHADHGMIDTVLRNLLNNTVKFTPHDGCVSITTRNKIQTIEIVVTDTGVGIAPERAKKLFNLAENTSTSGTSGEKGTGLGLQLCKDLIEKLDGKISTEGIGTSFRLTLPAYHEQEGQAGGPDHGKMHQNADVPMTANPTDQDPEVTHLNLISKKARG